MKKIKQGNLTHRSKYLFKNMGILAVSNFSSKILVFLLVPLYTSVLSTDEYGTYDLIISTITLVWPILTANIVDAVLRFSLEKSYDKKEIASTGIKYVSGSVVIVGIVLLLLHFYDIFPRLNGLKTYIFLYYVFYVFNQYFAQLAKGLERVKDMGIAGVVSTIVMIASNIFFLVVLKKGLIGFFIANILAQAIPTIYYFIRLKFWGMLTRIKKVSHLEKEMLFYCVPLICTTLGWWVNSTADKYTVAIMCGVAANGLLSVSYKIPSIISTLQGIFTQAWQISAIKEYGEASSESFYGKTFSYLNVAMSSACTFLILLSRPLAHILYSNDFYNAWRFVPFLLISTVLNSASGFVGPILSAKKDSKSLALSAVYGACANIILNIILVYFMGTQGATIATVISSYLIYYIRVRAAKNEFIVNEYWRVLLTWILLVVQAGLEIYLKAWYAEIAIIIIIIIINKKIIKDMLRILFKIF